MNVIDCTRKKVRAPLICSVLLAVPLLNACMEVPEEALEEAEQTENQEQATDNKKATKEDKSSDSESSSDSEASTSTTVDEDIENTLTDKQRELLEQMDEITPEEAAKNAQGKITVDHKALTQQVDELTEVAKFTDLEKFSAYMGQLFYQYHSGNIMGEEFLNYIEPHAADTFIEQIPVDYDARVQMFDTLQKLFNDNLESDIASYVVTKSKGLPVNGEVIFYREYTLNNGSKMYYQTTAKEVDGQWLLVDDVPTSQIDIAE